jgi:hypothetical protein
VRVFACVCICVYVLSAPLGNVASELCLPRDAASQPHARWFVVFLCVFVSAYVGLIHICFFCVLDFLFLCVAFVVFLCCFCYFSVCCVFFVVAVVVVVVFVFLCVDVSVLICRPVTMRMIVPPPRHITDSPEQREPYHNDIIKTGSIIITSTLPRKMDRLVYSYEVEPSEWVCVCMCVVDVDADHGYVCVGVCLLS